MAQNTSRYRQILKQAPVRALDPDGLAVVSAGTASFAVSAIVCWFARDYLAAAGNLWYLYVAITGSALGALGLAVSLTRRHRRQPGQASVEEPLIDTDRVPDRS